MYIYSFLHLFYIYTLLYIYSVIINIHARARAFTGCIANRSIGFFVRHNHWKQGESGGGRGRRVETFNCTGGDRIFNEQSCFFSKERKKEKRGKRGTAIRIEIREQRKTWKFFEFSFRTHICTLILCALEFVHVTPCELPSPPRATASLHVRVNLFEKNPTLAQNVTQRH